MVVLYVIHIGLYKNLPTSLIHQVSLAKKTPEITMKAYFSVVMVLCIVLLTIQSVEMKTAIRERRQSSNNSTLNAGDLVVNILKAIFDGISLRNLIGK
ncbi:hypothetical protein TNCT_536141 [Trichonephila clavata]|uniref:Uncharacterized protein n=1 Tax=Trichonephila clavata TaxID=2740835 RepID=A0A8X6G2F7_TRICU|nr:hypothetical protein TNCT_536141 [Trichonephila clavata]